MVEPCHTKGLTPKKDSMMDMTEENFGRVIAMRDELIFEQKEVIAKLKMTVNKLRQQRSITDGSKKVNNV